MQERLAERLGLSPRQVRYWRRKGYVPATRKQGRTWVYDFPAIQRLAIIARLLRMGASPQSVLASIKSLEEDAPTRIGKSLSALSLFVAGAEILASDGHIIFNATTRELVHPIFLRPLIRQAKEVAQLELEVVQG